MPDTVCIICFEAEPLDDFVVLHEKYDHGAHIECIGAGKTVKTCPLCRNPIESQVCQNINLKLMDSTRSVFDGIISGIRNQQYDTVKNLAAKNLYGVCASFKELLAPYGIFDIRDKTVYDCMYYYACCTSDYKLISAIVKFADPHKNQADYGYMYAAKNNLEFLKHIIRLGIRPSKRTLYRVLNSAFSDLSFNPKCLEFHWRKFWFSAPGPREVFHLHCGFGCGDLTAELLDFNRERKKYLRTNFFYYIDLRGYLQARKWRKQGL